MFSGKIRSFRLSNLKCQSKSRMAAPSTFFKFFTCFQGTTRQKFRRAHSPAAFALQFQNPQRILSAADHDSSFVRGQNFSRLRRSVLFDHFRLPDFQQLRFGFRWQKSERARPRRERAQAGSRSLRRLVPVNLPVLLFDFRGVAGTLRRVAAAAKFSRRHNRELFQPAVPRRVARAGRAGSANRPPAKSACGAGQDRAGVQTGIHFHDGHAGFSFAVGDGPLDRRGAAIFRQQRRVDVQAAERRQIQNGLRQNLSVSHDDDQVGRQTRAVRR